MVKIDVLSPDPRVNPPQLSQRPHIHQDKRKFTVNYAFDCVKGNEKLLNVI